MIFATHTIGVIGCKQSAMARNGSRFNRTVSWIENNTNSCALSYCHETMKNDTPVWFRGNKLIKKMKYWNDL